MASKIECFRTKVQVYDGNAEKVIYRTKLPKNPFAINPLTMQADPFLFVWNDTLYLFFEEKLLYSNGVLRMISTKDLNHWTSPVTVLQEPFHLSFPNVFVHDETVYMIPETGGAKEVRLYKATDETLKKFAYVITLLKHDVPTVVDYSDSDIIHNEGQYYLMTTVNYTGTNELELYYSSSLVGPYTVHPSSPVCQSNKYGRNAGSVDRNNDKLYRVAQDCSSGYGENVHLLEITSLNSESYKEQVVHENILDRVGDEFYKEGGHQYNSVVFRGKRIIATDAKSNKSLIVQRILTKLYFKLRKWLTSITIFIKVGKSS